LLPELATLSPQPVQHCRRLAAPRPPGRRGALPRCLRVDMQPPLVLPEHLSLRGCSRPCFRLSLGDGAPLCCATAGHPSSRDMSSPARARGGWRVALRSSRGGEERESKRQESVRGGPICPAAALFKRSRPAGAGREAATLPTATHLQSGSRPHHTSLVPRHLRTSSTGQRHPPTWPHVVHAHCSGRAVAVADAHSAERRRVSG